MSTEPLADSEAARLRELLRYTHEIARLGTWERDLVQGRLWWSDEFRELFHIPADEQASSQGFLARVHAEDRARIAAALGAAYQHPGESGYSFRVQRADGVLCRFQARVHVEADADGVPTRASGTIQDITAQYAIEEELRRQTAYLTAILNHLPQGISVFDDALRLQYWNARFGEVLELPPDLLYRNVPFEDLIMMPACRGEYGPGEPTALVEQRRALAMKFEAHRFERTRPNGRTHLVAGEPLHIDGRVAGFITTYTDITAHKDTERALEARNHELQTIIENIPCGVSMFDRELRLCASNSELRRVLDLPDTLFAAGPPTFADILLFNARRGEYGPGDPEEIAAELLARARHAQPHSFDRIRPDGKVLHIQGQPLPDGGFVTIYNDITELRRAERRQLLADKVFEYSPEAIVIIELSHRIISVNPAFTHITGHTADRVVGTRFQPDEGGHTAGSPADHNRTFWDALGHHGTFAAETNGLRANGEPYPRWLTMTTLREEAGGAITHYIAIFTDITERKRSEADIQHLAHHDALTGLANRFSLYARLEQAVADARRNTHSLAVMFLDLDRFKTINDSLGHQVGDTLLIAVGKRLHAAVRESDTVARLGGDEFVVVLQGIGGAVDAAHVAANLLQTLSAPHVLDGVTLHAIPSIGISLFPDDSTTPAGLLRNADAAMYHAKALGRGNYQFFTEALNRAATERLALEGKLRGALGRDEFELWYQPLFDARENRLTGFEALLRWPQPDGTMIAPDRFIPLAEETGIIVTLGHWVLRQACRQARRWRDDGYANLRIAVNLSVRQLRDTKLPESVTTILAECGLEPAALELEITESSVMERPHEAIGLLGRLKALGVSIAIDDFGTGYSSLSYLKLLPLDRLKIDRSFVSDIEHDANDAAIVTAAVSLAHNLGLSVIAEGVETAVQVERLRELGCDQLQGYYFSRPLPVAAVDVFLRNHTPKHLTPGCAGVD